SEASTKDIADYVGHSHASISQIVKAMSTAGVVSTKRNKNDARKNVLKLTPKGNEIINRIKPQYEDVSFVVEELLGETPHDVWQGLSSLERALDESDLFTRVNHRHKLRQEKQIAIVDYTPKYAEAFRDINLEWINKHFTAEEADLNYLDSPDESIIKPGGHIFMALLGDDVVGTCALVPMENQTFELAKMGVVPHIRGKRVGWQLGQACINWAKANGAKKLYLESSTTLRPAINLYRKLGFVEVAERPSPYSRANIYMELCL
ncbi:MAG: helix-turn-helix domain-containing GNAT family N-acetyltransferase, partial [Pseudomonadota bacterium]